MRRLADGPRANAEHGNITWKEYLCVVLKLKG